MKWKEIELANKQRDDATRRVELKKISYKYW
jgi:hypothetical protein